MRYRLFVVLAPVDQTQKRGTDENRKQNDKNARRATELGAQRASRLRAESNRNTASRACRGFRAYPGPFCFHPFFVLDSAQSSDAALARRRRSFCLIVWGVDATTRPFPGANLWRGVNLRSASPKLRNTLSRKRIARRAIRLDRLLFSLSRGQEKRKTRAP